MQLIEGTQLFKESKGGIQTHALQIMKHGIKFIAPTKAFILYL